MIQKCRKQTKSVAKRLNVVKCVADVTLHLTSAAQLRNIV
jgi:hypothetical protein